MGEITEKGISDAQVRIQTLEQRERNGGLTSHEKIELKALKESIADK